jgi:hypothetical protein
MADVKTGRKVWKPPKEGEPGWISPKEWKENRQKVVADLLAGLEEWKSDRTEAELADFLAKWDGYHGNNPHLIEMGSGSYATDVDARGAWMERGYVPIGKGTGIKIIQPLIRLIDDPDNKGKKKEITIGYKVGYVFDVRHVIDPDLREQWNNDHPQDENGGRYWGDEESIAKWHERWDK